jgi:hypothetical protein
MVKRWLLPGAMIAATLLLAVGILIGPRSTAAQDMSASPSAGMEAHPAHIHAGTCATLGEVVYPLEDVASVEDVTSRPETAGAMSSPASDSAEQMAGESTPMSDMDMMANVVAQSTTTVDASLDDILGAEHAINVHESMENIQNYIACGDITGTPTDGMLEVTLNELNGSGYEGRATLTDNGDGTTNVVVQLMMVQMHADEVATPTS